MVERSPTESSIVASIQRWLRSQGAWVCKTVGGPYRHGLPDLLAVLNGRAIALEVKRPGRGPTPLQRAELDRLWAAGAVVGIVHSLQEAQMLLQSYRQRCPECGTETEVGL